MKRKNGKQSFGGKLFGRLVRNGQEIELPVLELDPKPWPQHIRLGGWVGQNYVAVIVPVDRVTVYARGER
jgi:hypothetical protein